MPIAQTTLKNLIEKSGLVSKADLLLALTTARHLGCSITDVLLGRDLITEQDLGNILAKYYRVKFVDLLSLKIPSKILNLLPEQLAASHGVIAFSRKGNRVLLAMEDPRNLDALEIARKTIGSGIRLIPQVALSRGIKESLKLYKERERDSGEEETVVSPQKLSSPVRTIEQFLEDAIRDESSDVHIEPLSTQVLVRFRIDGVLHDRLTLPKDMHAPLVARIKILSELKLDEHRLPQDGRFPFQTKRGDRVSLRVSVIPTVYGEKVVLRILEDTLTKFTLEELGLLPEDQEIIRRIVDRTHGMFLITGPTGSGKTTTLYTLLGMLNKPGVNIITIEDPVENRVRRVNQIQVNPAVNLTFASGLRSILRQDPDIIMVGEIRDAETAVIAVNSAMTGHLVFSTVHANTSAGAIPRLLDLGTEPFLLASTLNMVVAQRLVRIICPECVQEIPLSPLVQRKLDEADRIVSRSIRRRLKSNYQAPGCPHCSFTGFRGRTGIFELLLVDEDIQDLIVSKAASGVIWKSARNKGSKTMLEDGLVKVVKRITTVEEVLRVIS